MTKQIGRPITGRLKRNISLTLSNPILAWLDKYIPKSRRSSWIENLIIKEIKEMKKRLERGKVIMNEWEDKLKEI